MRHWLYLAVERRRASSSQHRKAAASRRPSFKLLGQTQRLCHGYGLCFQRRASDEAKWSVELEPSQAPFCPPGGLDAPLLAIGRQLALLASGITLDTILAIASSRRDAKQPKRNKLKRERVLRGSRLGARNTLRSFVSPRRAPAPPAAASPAVLITGPRPRGAPTHSSDSRAELLATLTTPAHARSSQSSCADAITSQRSTREEKTHLSQDGLHGPHARH